MKKINKLLLLSSIMIVISSILLATKNISYLNIDNFNARYDYSVNIERNITFSFLLKRGLEHSLNWNGRIGELMLYLIAPLPDIIYKILNIFFYVIFMLLIMKYSLDYKDIKNNKSFLYPLIITVLVLYLDPLLWNTYLWMAGSCNHLWGLCILMIAFLPIRQFFFNSYKIKTVKLIPYIMVMFIAGTVSESYVPFVLGLTLLILIYKVIKEKKIYNWVLFSFISMLLGYIWLVFLCPSTKIRYLFYQDTSQTISIKEIIFQKFFFGFKPYIILITILIIIYLITFLIKKYILKQQIKLKKSFIYNLLLYIFSYSSIFVMFFSSTYNNRSVFIICFTTLILAIYLINEILNEFNFMLTYIISILCVVAIAIYSFYLDTRYTEYKNFSDLRNQYIEKQINTQKDTIIVPIYSNIKNDRIFDLAYETQLCSHDILKRKYEIGDNIKILCVDNYSINK